MPVTNGTILDPKCDILLEPDGVLGAGEAMRRREFIAFVGGRGPLIKARVYLLCESSLYRLTVMSEISNVKLYEMFVSSLSAFAMQEI